MEAWREELYSDELYHYGILGMKWGVRRYQNPDGTLTEAGKRHYGNGGENSGAGRSESRKRAKKKAVRFGFGIGALAATLGAVGAVSKSPKMFERNIKSGKDKEPKSFAEATTRETASGFTTAADLSRSLRELERKASGEVEVTLFDDNLTKKTDEQLRKEIERMQLETRWDELNSRQISRGKAQVSDYLDVGAKVATLATSAATIAALMYKVKHP